MLRFVFLFLSSPSPPRHLYALCHNRGCVHSFDVILFTHVSFRIFTGFLCSLPHIHACHAHAHAHANGHACRHARADVHMSPRSASAVGRRGAFMRHSVRVLRCALRVIHCAANKRARPEASGAYGARYGFESQIDRAHAPTWSCGLQLLRERREGGEVGGRAHGRSVRPLRASTCAR